MYARSSTLAILSAMALVLPANPTQRFSLGTTGAVTLNVDGAEARYGVVPPAVNGRPLLTVSLGATGAPASLILSVPGDRMPERGRYPVRSSWDDEAVDQQTFQAGLAIGSPEHPQGWFHGESGWVTITGAAAGWVSGQFDIRARGFTTAHPDDESRWVTVRGTFHARGDSTIVTIASLE
jgi:hypothetical protein